MHGSDFYFDSGDPMVLYINIERPQVKTSKETKTKKLYANNYFVEMRGSVYLLRDEGAQRGNVL